MMNCRKIVQESEIKCKDYREKGSYKKVLL